MNDVNRLLKHLPKIDLLLNEQNVASHINILGQKAVVKICREAVEKAQKEAVKSGLKPETEDILKNILQSLKEARSDILGKVLNGTGVLGHTNMGRSPLGEGLFEYLGKTINGYSNLEFNVLNRKRGT
jgi:L-seryl-tRNA(Ser) seleniumtransferase